MLTNGVKYHFYTDLDEKNVMDAKPFITIDFLKITDKDIGFLKLLHADGFSADAIRKEAIKIRETDKIRESASLHLSKPSDEIVRVIIRDLHKWGKSGILAGHVAKYRPMVSSAIKEYIKVHSGLEQPPDTVDVPIVKNKKWDEKRFLAQASEFGGDNYAEMCNKLLRSFESLGCEISYGKGQAFGRFYPVFAGKKRYWLCCIYNSSKRSLARLLFGSIKPPLNTLEYKKSFQSSLMQIEGIKIKDSDLDMYPSFDLMRLNSEKAYNQFIDIMKKYIEDIKASENSTVDGGI